MANNNTESKLNVWAKLLLARKKFLESGVQKTGKNIHLEFKYFELADIVPAVTAIGYEVGLLFTVSFNTDYATMKVINTDNPEEIIVFESPMKEIDSIESRTGGKLNNAIQNLGAVETYQRRYLYMAALDIPQGDGFDGEVGKPDTEERSASKKTKPKPPVTPEKREEIKQEVVDSDGQAEALQIEALQHVMQQLLDIDPEKESLVQEIVLQTNKFANISKTACETLIKELGDMVEAYNQVDVPWTEE